LSNRFPEWLKKKIPGCGDAQGTRNLIGDLGLNTVCSSARCPNQGECYSRRTATFLILGGVCTRNCRFCAVDKGIPPPPDPMEPQKVAVAVAALGLEHAVITSVTRDDLTDGGACHFVATIKAIRETSPEATIEVLTPDFKGLLRPVDMISSALPEVYNHNLETVPRLYRRVRPGAGYRRSLTLLERVKIKQPRIKTKSGIMLGLGESYNEVIKVMADLRSVDCDIITIGQYLSPSERHLEVQEFVRPEVFQSYRDTALKMGFRNVACGPFVRSSYKAGEFVRQVQK